MSGWGIATIEGFEGVLSAGVHVILVVYLAEALDEALPWESIIKVALSDDCTVIYSNGLVANLTEIIRSFCSHHLFTLYSLQVLATTTSLHPILVTNHLAEPLVLVLLFIHLTLRSEEGRDLIGEDAGVCCADLGSVDVRICTGAPLACHTFHDGVLVATVFNHILIVFEIPRLEVLL